MTGAQREHVTFIVKALVGGESSATAELPPLLDSVIHHASLLLGKGVNVHAVDSAVPHIFSLHGLPEPVIAYTSRYLELTAACRYVLATPMASRERRSIGRSIFSEIFAAKLVREGRIDTALRLFLASWFYAPPILLGSQWRLRDLLQDSRLATVAATAGFGIAHEAGHFMDKNIDGDTARAILVEGVADQLARGLSEVNARPERRVHISGEAEASLVRHAAQMAGHPLNPEHVRDEVMADFFAWDTLLNLVITSSRVSGILVDDIGLAGEVCMQMIVLYFFERAEVLAREPGPWLSSVEAFAGHAFHDVSLHVRSQMLGQVMSRVIALTHHGDETEAEEIAKVYRDQMLHVSQAVRPAFRELEMEIDWAIEVAERGAAFDDEMVNLLGAATQLLRKKYPVFEADVRRFFAVAGATDAPATRLLRDQIE